MKGNLELQMLEWQIYKIEHRSENSVVRIRQCVESEIGKFKWDHCRKNLCSRSPL